MFLLCSDIKKKKKSKDPINDGEASSDNGQAQTNNGKAMIIDGKALLIALTAPVRDSLLEVRLLLRVACLRPTWESCSQIRDPAREFNDVSKAALAGGSPSISEPSSHRSPS